MPPYPIMLLYRNEAFKDFYQPMFKSAGREVRPIDQKAISFAAQTISPCVTVYQLQTEDGIINALPLLENENIKGKIFVIPTTFRGEFDILERVVMEQFKGVLMVESDPAREFIDILDRIDKDLLPK